MKYKYTIILFFSCVQLKIAAQTYSASAFEKIIFEVENAYYDGHLSYDEYENKLDFHTKRIVQLANANKEKLNEIEYPKNWSGIDVAGKTEQQTNKENLLLNWAIYNYLTDTTWYKQDNGTYATQYPMQYAKADPFGKENWENTMVTTLLDTTKQKGNCFSLAALYYVFSLRLQTEAYLCTAPQHIFIQHLGTDGNYYNIELGSHSFPGAGTIKAYTYTTHQAVESGVAMRRLNEQEAIALCFVQMAKGYEAKTPLSYGSTCPDFSRGAGGGGFMLQCANQALQYDSLCLTALLLKGQILEKIISNNTEDKNAQKALSTTKEKLIDLGYASLPSSMQTELLGQASSNTKVLPFSSIDKTQAYYTASQNKFPEINSTAIENLSLSEKENQIDPVSFALTIDPLAEKYPSLSPYSFCANNPIVFVDPSGNDILLALLCFISKTSESPKKEITASVLQQDLNNLQAINNAIKKAEQNAEYAKETGDVNAYEVALQAADAARADYAAASAKAEADLQAEEVNAARKKAEVDELLHPHTDVSALPPAIPPSMSAAPNEEDENIEPCISEEDGGSNPDGNCDDIFEDMRDKDDEDQERKELQEQSDELQEIIEEGIIEGIE